METLAPWLLLVIAALVAACVVLYCHLRQVESATQARETLFLDDLDELRSQIEQAHARIGELEGRLAPGPSVPSAESWQVRALHLARNGLTPAEIARELEVSIAEVQLALAFPLRLPED